MVDMKVNWLEPDMARESKDCARNKSMETALHFAWRDQYLPMTELK